MPVNKDPNKRRRRGGQPAGDEQPQEQTSDQSPRRQSKEFGKETDEDREKAAADAEWQNLWDATEVIDMDKF